MPPALRFGATLLGGFGDLGCLPLVLGGSLGRLEVVFSSRAGLGVPLGKFWGSLRASWAFLGASWGALGASLGVSWGLCGVLGRLGGDQKRS